MAESCAPTCIHVQLYEPQWLDTACMHVPVALHHSYTFLLGSMRQASLLNQFYCNGRLIATMERNALPYAHTSTRATIGPSVSSTR